MAEVKKSQDSQKFGTKKGVENPWKTVWKRFKKNRLALLGASMLTILILTTVFAPLIATHSLDEMDFMAMDQAPTDQHILGTDSLGRDIFSRLLYAGRISLTVGIVAQAIAIVIGTILGSIAGYYGGKVDTVIMRVVDMVRSFPALLLAITVVAVVGEGIYNIMMVLGFLGWTSSARLVRGEFLRLKSLEFIESAQALGSRDARIIFMHMLPNSFAPILVSATLGVGGAIMTEAALSYLGLGVQPPTPSWGNMLQAANDIIILQDKPWLWVPPGIAILIAVLSINFVGDGLRDALDPKLKN